MPLPDLFRRTAFRTGLGLAALLSAAMLSVFGVTLWLGSAALSDVTDRSIAEQLELLAARPPELLPFMIESRLNRQPAVITLVGLYAPDGALIIGDIGRVPPDVPLDGRVHALGNPEAGGVPAARLRIAGRRLPDGRLLFVGRDVGDILALRSRLVRALLLGLLPAVVLSILGGAIFGLRAERRLARLRAAAERIMDGHIAERLPVSHRGDELDQACRHMNRVLDRAEELVSALKGVGEDIAHDLRTPLTAVRTGLERGLRARDTVARQAAMERAIAGIDRALAIVSALLRIGEIERGRQRAGFAAFDLAAVLRDAAEAYLPLAEDKGLRLSLDAAGPVQIFGDPALVAEAVMNLLDNAVKFTPAGGTVQVALAGAPDRPVVRIADTGPGIPPEERAAVFRRFWRGDRSRSTQGQGLGLNLVAAIAKLHGFGIRLADSRPGCTIELLCWPAGGTVSEPMPPPSAVLPLIL
ncbi:sensor histidine kinase [Roseicella aquatilis]|uniref:histidine kinase n=1 Tax=Roseicella aquatilis TaxID=2527868 RepID=A0A4R4D5P3_9PROT|nr:HAMP domain-containing sensor histidine kinase [Roseicella aquatilis]TCZ52755.1 HAMP domain-containing histidine kinase [Roseicella aquatilis]